MRWAFTTFPRTGLKGFTNWACARRLRRRGVGDGLEHLPAAAKRLVELDAVEQRLRVGIVRVDAYGQAHALRVEQRQQVDLPAVVQRLRAAECGVGRSGSALQQLRALTFLVERDERVLDVLERTHDRVFVAEHGLALAALGDVVDRLSPPCVEQRHREQCSDIAEARRAERDAVDIEALAAEYGAEHEPREPFRHGLLPARVRGVELRLRGEQVGTPLQQCSRLSCTRGRKREFAARNRNARCIERLVADQNRDAVTRNGGERFERRYRRARSRRFGLRALDVERRREAGALPGGHEAERFVLCGRYRAQGVELAQRADEGEVVGRDVAHHQQPHAARRVLGRERVGGRGSGASTQPPSDVDLPGNVEAALPTLRVGNRLLVTDEL